MQNERKSLLSLFVGGLVIVLPVLLLGVAFGAVLQVLTGWARPLFDALPGTVIQSPFLRAVLLTLVIAAFFVLVGFFAQRHIGLRVWRRLEVVLMGRVPFYSALRVLTCGLADSGNKSSMIPALVTVDVPGLQQFGFILERLPDGFCSVFLPSCPNPSSGTLVVVEPARIRELDVPVRDILHCMIRWGHGAAGLLAKDGMFASKQEKAEP
jgi:uncharacterized membrane protein